MRGTFLFQRVDTQCLSHNGLKEAYSYPHSAKETLAPKRRWQHMKQNKKTHLFQSASMHTASDDATQGMVNVMLSVIYHNPPFLPKSVYMVSFSGSIDCASLLAGCVIGALRFDPSRRAPRVGGVTVTFFFPFATLAVNRRRNKITICNSQKFVTVEVCNSHDNRLTYSFSISVGHVICLLITDKDKKGAKFL